MAFFFFFSGLIIVVSIYSRSDDIINPCHVFAVAGEKEKKGQIWAAVIRYRHTETHDPAEERKFPPRSFIIHSGQISMLSCSTSSISIATRWMAPSSPPPLTPNPIHYQSVSKQDECLSLSHCRALIFWFQAPSSSSPSSSFSRVRTTRLLIIEKPISYILKRYVTPNKALKIRLKL